MNHICSRARGQSVILTCLKSRKDSDKTATALMWVCSDRGLVVFPISQKDVPGYIHGKKLLFKTDILAHDKGDNFNSGSLHHFTQAYGWEMAM